MSAASALEERLVDAVGPIVVKEVRQGLRAKVFGIGFGLLLLGCLVVAVTALAEARNRPGASLGEQYFAIFLGALGLLEFFVIPFTAFRNTVREREDETWVLLALTGLGGRRIVRGKIASALSQGMLYASACAPFVLFSYYLNGVSIPILALALLASAVWTVFLVSFAVALGTQAHTRRGRGGAQFGAIALLGLATFFGIAFCAVLADEGERLLHQEAFLWVLAGLFAFLLSTAWLLAEGGAASLCLPSEAASRGPRLLLAVQGVLGTAGVAAGLLLGRGDKEALVVCAVLFSLYLAVAGTFAVSEHDGYPVAWKDRGGGWLKPGALRSFVLLAVLLTVATAVFVAVHPSLPGGDSSMRRIHGLFVAPAYVLLYLSLAVVVGRLTPLRLLGEPVATRASMLGVTTLSVVVSPILSLVFDGKIEGKAWNLFNPIFGLANFLSRYNASNGRAAAVVLCGTAVMAGLVAWVVLWSRDGVRSA